MVMLLVGSDEVVVKSIDAVAIIVMLTHIVIVAGGELKGRA